MRRQLLQRLGDQEDRAREVVARRGVIVEREAQLEAHRLERAGLEEGAGLGAGGGRAAEEGGQCAYTWSCGSRPPCSYAHAPRRLAAVGQRSQLRETAGASEPRPERMPSWSSSPENPLTANLSGHTSGI